MIHHIKITQNLKSQKKEVYNLLIGGKIDKTTFGKWYKLYNNIELSSINITKDNFEDTLSIEKIREKMVRSVCLYTPNYDVLWHTPSPIIMVISSIKGTELNVNGDANATAITCTLDQEISKMLNKIIETEHIGYNMIYDPNYSIVNLYRRAILRLDSGSGNIKLNYGNKGKKENDFCKTIIETFNNSKGTGADIIKAINDINEKYRTIITDAKSANTLVEIKV